MPENSFHLQQLQWSDDQLHRPHDVLDKAKRVEAMFDAIAPSYDLNNRLHSLWRDQAWRRTAVRMADLKTGDTVLDVACGTGDLAMAFATASQRPKGVIGVDFTSGMLAVAIDKKQSLEHSVPPTTPLSYYQGDAMNLPIENQSVDVVSIAFGIRNVAKPSQAITEFWRVLKPGGRLIILEFSQPTNPVMSKLYHFYFNHILPRTASWIARDKTGAYRYLPKSVQTFITRDQMSQLMREVGLMQIISQPLTLGIAVVYRGVKPEAP